MACTCVDTCPRVGCPPREAIPVLYHCWWNPTARMPGVCCCMPHPVIWAEEPVGGRELTGSQQSFKVGHHSGLGISRSPEAGCHLKPRSSMPGASHLLNWRSKSSGRRGKVLPWAKSWGRKRQKNSTVRFTGCMGSVGGEDLVVNRNRWASSQEKRWKKKKRLSLGGRWEWRLGGSEKVMCPPAWDKSLVRNTKKNEKRKGLPSAPWRTFLAGR